MRNGAGVVGAAAPTRWCRTRRSPRSARMRAGVYTANAPRMASTAMARRRPADAAPRRRRTTRYATSSASSQSTDWNTTSIAHANGSTSSQDAARPSKRGIVARPRSSVTTIDTIMRIGKPNRSHATAHRTMRMRRSRTPKCASAPASRRRT